MDPILPGVGVESEIRGVGNFTSLTTKDTKEHEGTLRGLQPLELKKILWWS